MKTTHKSILIAGLLVISAPLTFSETLSDFENGKDNWTFSPGGEYGGAQGSAEAVQESDVGALKLTGKFSEGGKYVAAFRKIEPGQAAQTVTLKVKAGEEVRYILVRLRDSGGQVHQHRCNLKSTADWQEVKLSDFTSNSHWGGANDGKFHLPLTEVGVLIEKAGINGNSADVWIDSVILTGE